MAKDPARIKMESAIKKFFIPHLRDLGFKGSFPHFRKVEPEKIKLITFQFYSSGSSFIVELAECESDGVTHSWGKHIAPSKVTAHDVGKRHRLGSLKKGDHWFEFGKRSYESKLFNFRLNTHYEKVAKNVLAHFQSEAEDYWSKNA